MGSFYTKCLYPSGCKNRFSDRKTSPFMRNICLKLTSVLGNTSCLYFIIFLDFTFTTSMYHCMLMKHKKVTTITPKCFSILFSTHMNVVNKIFMVILVVVLKHQMWFTGSTFNLTETFIQSKSNVLLNLHAMHVQHVQHLKTYTFPQQI